MIGHYVAVSDCHYVAVSDCNVLNQWKRNIRCWGLRFFLAFFVPRRTLQTATCPTSTLSSLDQRRVLEVEINGWAPGGVNKGALHRL